MGYSDLCTCPCYSSPVMLRTWSTGPAFPPETRFGAEEVGLVFHCVPFFWHFIFISVRFVALASSRMIHRRLPSSPIAIRLFSYAAVMSLSSFQGRCERRRLSPFEREGFSCFLSFVTLHLPFPPVFDNKLVLFAVSLPEPFTFG